MPPDRNNPTATDHPTLAEWLKRHDAAFMHSHRLTIRGSSVRVLEIYEINRRGVIITVAADGWVIFTEDSSIGDNETGHTLADAERRLGIL